jgi:hypothetical protein
MKKYTAILKMTNPRGVVIYKDTKRRFETGEIERSNLYKAHDFKWMISDYKELKRNYPNMDIEVIAYRLDERIRISENKERVLKN